eukprot:6814689-Ditylum_brightwellii.AAC.1
MYVTKTIFKSSKDNVVYIGYPTNINPQQIDWSQYQDQINKLIDAVADEKHENNPKLYEMNQTTSKVAKNHVHLYTDTAFVKVAKQKYETEAIRVFVRQPFFLLVLEWMLEIVPMISPKSVVKFIRLSLKYDPMIKNNIKHYKTLIWEQNIYPTNYADFRIGGVSKAMLNVD